MEREQKLVQPSVLFMGTQRGKQPGLVLVPWAILCYTSTTQTYRTIYIYIYIFEKIVYYTVHRYFLVEQGYSKAYLGGKNFSSRKSKLHTT